MSKNSIFKTTPNNFISETIASIVVKFHMKHDQTPGFQNCKIGSGQESKMAAVTKNNHKINFLSGTTGYIWLNFGMEYH